MYLIIGHVRVDANSGALLLGRLANALRLMPARRNARAESPTRLAPHASRAPHIRVHTHVYLKLSSKQYDNLLAQMYTPHMI